MYVYVYIHMYVDGNYNFVANEKADPQSTNIPSVVNI